LYKDLPLIGAEIAPLSQKERELSFAVNEADLARQRVEHVKANIDKIKKEVLKLKGKAEGLKLLKEAFGNNGIKAMVADLTVPKLENRVNEILSRLSDFAIRMETQKEGAGKDTVLEGLFISVINGEGNETDFDAYSGGERLKITVAISEALAEMGKADFRILDELFVGLDDDSTEKFAEIMVELNDRFSQLVCVSHLKSIKDIFPDRVTAVKKNGITEMI